MSDIPEHILAQVHRLAAEGMPIEQIAFYTRISPQVIEEEIRKMEQPATEPGQGIGQESTPSSEDGSSR